MSTMKNCARIIFGILGVSFLGFRLDATVPAGYYYAADGKNGAELKTALYEIISSMHTLGYGSGEDATWEGFSRTDRKEDGSVWDRYSDEMRYFDSPVWYKPNRSSPTLFRTEGLANATTTACPTPTLSIPDKYCYRA